MNPIASSGVFVPISFEDIIPEIIEDLQALCDPKVLCTRDVQVQSCAVLILEVGMNRLRFVAMLPLLGLASRAAARSLQEGEVPAKAVFTPDEVKSLNAFQRAGVRHPFTCVRGRDRNHLDGEGVLLATERGWVCLYCDYTQDWAYSSMRNWRWKEIHWRELEAIRRLR